tara:strand:- start:5525 stop:5944 length:420 start_codon:yes stop_codon:yes gene_type:complete
MNKNPDSFFDQALLKYKEGASYEELLQDFLLIVESNPSHFAAWTCLSWLQLLTNQNNKALISARNAVKLNNQDPQARINLSLALLATNSKGVRENVDFVRKCISMVPDIKSELIESLEDGLTRKPDWGELSKIRSWLGV